MTAEELTDAGWNFAMRRRKDGVVRVRAVHKERGLDLTVWGGNADTTEDQVRDLMIREYVEPAHILLVAEAA